MEREENDFLKTIDVKRGEQVHVSFSVNRSHLKETMKTYKKHAREKKLRYMYYKVKKKVWYNHLLLFVISIAMVRYMSRSKAPSSSVR